MQNQHKNGIMVTEDTYKYIKVHKKVLIFYENSSIMLFTDKREYFILSSKQSVSQQKSLSIRRTKKY